MLYIPEPIRILKRKLLRKSEGERFLTERFERLLPMVADEQGFQHQTHRVEIRGLCRVCREADAGAVQHAGTIF